MALEKQVIPLKILGLSGKADPKAAPAGVLSIAENVVAVRRTDGGIELRKRNGFSEVPGAKAIDGGGVIAAAVTGAAYNDELVLCDGLRLYSYSQTAAKWVIRGKAQSIAADLTIVSGNEGGQVGQNTVFALDDLRVNTDVAVQSGYSCHASSGNDLNSDVQNTGLRIYVRDIATGVILGSHLIGTGRRRARVVGVGGFFLIFTWKDGPSTNATITVYRISTATPSAIDSEVDVATDLEDPLSGLDTGVGAIFDATSDEIGGRAWVAYRNTSLGLTIKSWVAATNSVGVSSVYSGVDPNECIGFLNWNFSNGSGYVGVCDQTGPTGVLEARIITFTTSTGAESANLLLDGSLGFGVGNRFKNITGYRTTGGVLNAFWSHHDSVSSGSGVVHEKISGYSGGSLWDVMLSVALAGRAFKVGSSWYLQAARSFTRNRTILLEIAENATGFDGDSSVAGLLLSSDSDGEPVSRCCLPSVSALSATSVLTSVAADMNSVDPTTTTRSTEHFANIALTMEFSGSGLGRPVVFNGALQIPGAAHRAYDGKDVVEVGFFVDPEAPVGLVLNSTGPPHGLTPDSSYQYCTTWARIDAVGRVHRSAPSPASTIVTPTAAVDPNPSVNGLLYTLRVTDTHPRYTVPQNQAVSATRIELWRTQADLDVFYLVGIFENDAVNDVVGQFDDKLTDDEIQGNEILYTTSGELDNQKAPSVKSLHVFADRLFALTGDRSVWHSKESAEGFGPEFSDEFRILTPGGDGAPTGLGSVDQTLVIFKRKRAYVTSGGGPDDKGAGAFPRPLPLETDLGLIGPNSAVDVPGGILCETPEGRFTLTRSLAFEPVEGTDGYAVAAAGGVGSDARSMTALVTNGAVLVRDWQLGQWYAWTRAANGLAGVAVARWKNQIVIFQSDGTVLREITGQSFDAASTPINEKVEFTYVALNNARVYRLAVVGEILASTTLTETTTYNNDDGTATSKSRACTTADKQALNVVPNTGRMESLKVMLQETSITEGFRLSQVNLEVGVKPGLKKYPSSRNFT